MHYQREPHPEAKVVWCTRGALYEVALDLWPTSPSYLRGTGITLDADDHTMLYIPEGCAHGYQTLTDDSEIVYLTWAPYERTSRPALTTTNPAFGIEWPRAIEMISGQDAE
jgi:dTDP-4-dehydrorhamnose 3,5-epimerase